MKAAIRTAGTLKYFDPKVGTVLQCVASSNGLGAVLMLTENRWHMQAELWQKQRKITVIWKKDCLHALVFAVNRYHQYIYGLLPVIVEADHRPLVVILKKPLPQAPKRLQRMMMELRYEFWQLCTGRGGGGGCRIVFGRYLVPCLPSVVQPCKPLTTIQQSVFVSWRRDGGWSRECHERCFMAYQSSGCKSWCEILQSIQTCSNSFNWSNQDGQMQDVRYQCRSGPTLTFGMNLSLQME